MFYSIHLVIDMTVGNIVAVDICMELTYLYFSEGSR